MKFPSPMTIQTGDKDVPKNLLYQGVKILLEADCPHLLLTQHKLFTLFSIGFQYFLYLSTKESGSYILRIEDSLLAGKLARKAKDSSTRKFLQSMILPRKIKYGKSSFHLDFFHPGSWARTNQIPPEEIRGSLIVKNPDGLPMTELDEEEEEEQMPRVCPISPLLEITPKSVTILCPEGTAKGLDLDKISPRPTPVEFPFIKSEPRWGEGINVGMDINPSDY